MEIQKTADGFDTLFSEEYKQTFHSTHGVLQEAEHVFLNGAGVKQRLINNQPTSVLEIGFGTGFNFFLTANEANACNTTLEFVSVEKELLSYKTFCNLNHDKLLLNNDFRFQFLDWCKKQPENIPDGKYGIKITNTTNLTILIGNALNVSLPENKFDAVYLDAFSPDSNPELWTTSFFTKLISAMNQEAILSTYSAKGSVRRSLEQAGFEVSKKAGPIGKREMISARKR